MNQLVDRLQTRMADLVEQSYSNIKVDEFCNLVGLDEATAVKFATERHWTHLKDTNVLQPFSTNTSKQPAGVNNEKLLSHLTDYVTFLES